MAWSTSKARSAASAGCSWKNEETAQEEEHLIPHGNTLSCSRRRVHKASISPMARRPHEILEILGAGGAVRLPHLAVQEVYRLQGVTINDKHIEIIIRPDAAQGAHHRSGDSEWFWGEQVDAGHSSAKISGWTRGRQASRGRADPARHTRLAETESFISAASFQEPPAFSRMPPRSARLICSGLKDKRDHGSS